MVSLAAQPGRPFAIFLRHQTSKLVSIHRARCWHLSHRAWLVGCSSSLEDDFSDSWEDVSQLVGSSPRGQTLHRSPHGCQRHDLTLERVFCGGERPGPSSPSEATWPSLKTSASPSQISVYSSSRGASSSAWEGSDPLLDSLSSLVVQEWAEPDRQLRHEVILWEWLHN